MIQNELKVKALINSLPARAHWIFANEAIVRAIRCETEVVKGWRTRALYTVLKILRLQNIQRSVVLIGCFMRMLKIWYRQLSVWRDDDNERPNLRSGQRVRIFVGFGARAEEKMFYDFARHQPSVNLRINQTKVSSYGAAKSVSVKCLVAEVFITWRIATEALQVLSKESRHYFIDWLVCILKDLPNYAYAKVWFGHAKASWEIEEVTFITNDVAAFAACHAGLDCHYLQHGLLSRNLIFPPVRKVTCLTRYESCYLEALYGFADIETRVARKDIPDYSARMAVVVASGWHEPEEMNLVSPVLIALSRHDVDIVVRPSPSENPSDYWLSSEAPPVRFRVGSPNGSLVEFLENENAVMLISWGSTALVDALYCGVIPICLGYTISYQVIDNMVFPLLKCCLTWERDAKRILGIVESEELYGTVLSELLAKESKLAEKFKSSSVIAQFD